MENGCAQWPSREKAPNGGSGAKPPELVLFVAKTVLFSHGFKNDVAILVFVAYKFSI